MCPAGCSLPPSRPGCSLPSCRETVGGRWLTAVLSLEPALAEGSSLTQSYSLALGTSCFQLADVGIGKPIPWPSLATVQKGSQLQSSLQGWLRALQTHHLQLPTRLSCCPLLLLRSFPGVLPAQFTHRGY